jgi:hypothetical protein
MKTEKNYIDYGIYIDRKHAFIISLNHVIHEELIDEQIEENEGGNHSTGGSDDVNQQSHIQNSRNEQLKKFCKSIIAKIEHAHSIFVFGPSQTKFELQKELRESNHLKHIPEELMVTDVMDKAEAIRFVKDHYTQVKVGHQVFTAAKKD